MDLNEMSSQAETLGETLIAAFTLVRLDPSVDPKVALSAAFRIEAPATLFTLERFLPRVNPKVSLQCLVDAEALAAVFARERHIC